MKRGVKGEDLKKKIDNYLTIGSNGVIMYLLLDKMDC